MSEEKLINKSIIKSRLRLTKSAFAQLVHHGLKMATGFKTDAKGLGILIHSIEINHNAFSANGIIQDLLIKLSVEKAQGWMPFKSDTEVKVNWTWSLTHIEGYPAIRIQHLEVSSDKMTKVGLLNLNIGVPKIIERRIFAEMKERIPQIEDAANQQIRKACNRLFSKTFEISLPGRSKDHAPKVKLEKWLWDANIEQSELIFDLNVTAQTSWMSMAFSSFQFHVNQKILPIDTNSTLRLPLPFEEIYFRSEQIKIPVGKLGISKVGAMNLTIEDIKNGKMRLQLIGDVAAGISLDIEIKDELIPRFEISNFDLKLENKLLDFGASFFEHKIQRSLQDEMDKQLKEQVNGLVDMLNDYLSGLQSSIFIHERALSLNDCKINAFFHGQILMLELKSDYFSSITINEFPEVLLNHST